MTRATITSKGQITIPVSIRSELKVGPGDKIEFVRLRNGHYEILPATQDISALKGMVKSNATVSVDEMNTAIKKRAIL